MRKVRHRLGLGVVACGVTLAVVCAGRSGVAGSASDDVDDPKMARLYRSPPPAAPPAADKPTNIVPAKAAPVQVPAPRAETPRPQVAKQAAPAVQPAKTEPPKVEVAKVEPALAPPAPTPVSPVTVAAPKSAPAKAVSAPAALPKAVAMKVALAGPEDAKGTHASTPAPASEGARSTTPAPTVDVAARPTTSLPAAERPAADRAWPYAPRLKLAYRRFPFARVGSSAGTTPTASTSESFESVSVDLYPMSWYLRVGLSTQFGWESEKFDRSGDYFIAETASVGFQWPGRFTPFVEALAGAGYMRRVMADLNLPTAYWQVGVDAGVEIYLANRAYVSLAIGYLHPGNLFVMQSSLMSVKTDSWSLKIGVGI